MIRLLILRWHRRWLLHALDSCRQTMANAEYSEAVFSERLRAVDAAIAMADLERRFPA